MNDQQYPNKLARPSAHLKDLFVTLSGYGQAAITLGLADESAATAGEIMVELVGQRRDELAR